MTDNFYKNIYEYIFFINIFKFVISDQGNVLLLNRPKIIQFCLLFIKCWPVTKKRDNTVKTEWDTLQCLMGYIKCLKVGI